MWPTNGDMPVAGESGVDLYGQTGTTYTWLGTGAPINTSVKTGEKTFILSDYYEEYILYLPLYNGVVDVQIGVPDGKTLTKPSPRTNPIVIYGTSINEGGFCSRPGAVHTTIIGQELNVPIINLGFANSGKMEVEIATLLGELNPRLYIVDCLHNMDAAMVTQRVAPFIAELRKYRPTTPILLAEDCKENYISPSARGSALITEYNKLKSTDDKLYFITAEGRLGTDGATVTVDGLHLNDLGNKRQAESYIAKIRRIISFEPIEKIFTSNKTNMNIIIGNKAGYKVKYSGGTCEKIHIPSWAIIKSDSIMMTAPSYNCVDSLYFLLKDGENITDTLNIKISVTGGTSIKSAIITRNTNDLSITPVFSNNEHMFMVNTKFSENFFINVYDITGKKLWQYISTTAKHGDYKIKYNNKKMKRGHYFVILKQGRNNITKKFICN